MLRDIPPILTQPSRSRDSFGGPGLRFTPGETFRGTVVEARPEGDVLILARGTKFHAVTTHPLQAGENHLFQVRSAGERILLKVLGGAPGEQTSAVRLWASGRPARAELGRILGSLGAAAGDKKIGEAVRGLLALLRDRMPAMVYRAPEGKGVDWLVRQLRESGLFFEARAARLVLEKNDAPLRTLASSDLKGILLALKAAFGKGSLDDPTAAGLARQVDQALSIVQQDQMLNLTAWKEGLGWFWFIPGHPEDGFRGGELFARKPREGDEGYSLSLTLDFTRLGRMDVAVHMNRSVVSLRILVEDGKTADLVENHLEELRERLGSSGLYTGTITCRERREEDTEWAPFLDSASVSGAVDVVI
ncbi:MAG: flagellar hook-length control protein FliK [Deltaproteobacteria bacterium]|nr:flagellar hook-length control protein FliK [Deltaproteobacteria bacterium]